MLNIGDKAPLSIKVLDEKENKVSLNDFKGEYIVVYFYPKDSTPGCTKESCDFRDLNSEIEKLGAKIIGTSKDSLASHEKFKTKHKLNFELWSDPEHKLMEAFGSWGKKKMMGREYMGTIRSTFIIDPKGKIVHVWDKVKVLGHVADVFEQLKQLIK
jgi:thioredoxin-dependent peroxiredoxin